MTIYLKVFPVAFLLVKGECVAEKLVKLPAIIPLISPVISPFAIVPVLRNRRGWKRFSITR